MRGRSNPIRIERAAEHDTPVKFTEATLQPEIVVNPSGESGARTFGIVALVVLAALTWVTITNTELSREDIASI